MVAALVIPWLGLNVALVAAMVRRSHQPTIVRHHQKREEIRALEYVWSLS